MLSYDTFVGCDEKDSGWTRLCQFAQYNGAVFMRQGLYHCSPYVHNYCPGSGQVGSAPGMFKCVTRVHQICPPGNKAPSDIGPTSPQSIYYDGMEYLRCSDIP